MTRLDKILSDTLPCTRKEAGIYIRGRRVRVDGEVVTKADTKVDEKNSIISFDGTELNVRGNIYIMLNKPQGLISATEDVREKTVLSLLPDEYMTKGLFPAGRLDKDTTGLLILTNDGILAHRLLSPKNKHEKTYIAVTDVPFEDADVERVEDGVLLDDGMTCPVKLKISNQNPNKAYITITEGRFHEVKRICIAIGKRVVELERVEFCGVKLDENLERGMWRHLTDGELDILKKI